YSDFNDFTGFISAAFTDWKLTVIYYCIVFSAQSIVCTFTAFKSSLLTTSPAHSRAVAFSISHP
ncbi:MAG TPA: hypothetical protein VD794_10005, partial [Flavisolibacter sp.]|nr:hypothetical protein [Flavisolibacter sp.]